MVSFSGLSFRIWLPFALSITLFILAAAFYYPSKQELLFYENTISKNKELAKTVALGVELTLSSDNFSGLKKTIDLATSSSEFEFISIVEIVDKEEVVYLVNPDTFNRESILNRGEKSFIYETYPIDSELMNGYVLICLSKNEIQKNIYAINLPVYLFLAILLIVSLIYSFLLQIQFQDL